MWLVKYIVKEVLQVLQILSSNCQDHDWNITHSIDQAKYLLHLPNKREIWCRNTKENQFRSVTRPQTYIHCETEIVKFLY